MASGGGPFPAKTGLSSDGLLTRLGVPAGFGLTRADACATVPSSYPEPWASLQGKEDAGTWAGSPGCIRPVALTGSESALITFACLSY